MAMLNRPNILNIGSTRGQDTVRRRDVLLVGGSLALATASVAGCDLLSTDPESGDGDDGASARKGAEAPALARQVESGDLPPVAERLPNKPLVVEPIEQVGVYGGEWRTALLGPANALYIHFSCGYDPLVRWTLQWTGALGADEIIPNVAESFDVSEGGTVFTFQLREGMRWSDGEPFTADDVVFAMDDVLLNEEINPVPPAFLTTLDDEPGQIEKIDDHAFRIVFSQPNGLFLQRLATLGGNQLVNKPFHYLSEFHQDHNPDIDQLVEQEGVEDWIELYQRKGGAVAGTPYNALWFNADLPTLWAWHVTVPVGESDRVVLERNPYYWKTDPDGSQLPYLDQVTFVEIPDQEVLLLRTAQGDLNLEVSPDTRFTTPRNKPVLARDREEGDFRFLDVQDTRFAVMHIMLNLTHKDPVKREIFANKDFRIGLSHAIDRAEIIDTTLQRQAEPYQAAPLPESPFYDEEFATQYLEYDEATANEHLDRVAPEKDDDGRRLGPDGNPISVTIDYVPDFRPEWADMLELIQGTWRAVGVEISVNPVDRSLWSVRTADNEHDAGVWHGGGGLDVVLNSVFFFPDRTASYYATPWGTWYASQGEQGEEPPPEPKRQMELYDQLKASADPDEQTDLMREIITISKQQFYSIGVARETAKYFVASNEFRNIPEPMIINPTYPTPGPTKPEQYFLESQ